MKLENELAIPRKGEEEEPDMYACAVCGIDGCVLFHSGKSFCSLECMKKDEGEDWMDIKKCLVHESYYKGECEACEIIQ